MKLSQIFLFFYNNFIVWRFLPPLHFIAFLHSVRFLIKKRRKEVTKRRQSRRTHRPDDLFAMKQKLSSLLLGLFMLRFSKNINNLRFKLQCTRQVICNYAYINVSVDSSFVSCSVFIIESFLYFAFLKNRTQVTQYSM